jgi:putative ABC transport system permease protein
MRPIRRLTPFSLLLLAVASGLPRSAVAQDAPSCPDGLEMVLERGFAEAEGVGVGDVLSVRGGSSGPWCEASVAGVFEPRPDPARLTVERPGVVFHLPDLQQITGKRDRVDRFSLKIRAGVDVDSLADALTARIPGTQVVPTREVTDRASTTFAVIERFHRAIALITLIAGGVFLACIMFLKVGERREAIAALRLIGVSRRTLMAWVVAEAAIVSSLGGLIGVGLGGVASLVINGYYQRFYDTSLLFALVTPGIVARALALALVLGLLAGVVAGLGLLRRDALVEAGR